MTQSNVSKPYFRIGEISLMRDLTKTMEITMKDLDNDDAEGSEATEAKDNSSTSIPSYNPASSGPYETDSKIPKAPTPPNEKITVSTPPNEKFTVSTPPPRSGASTPSGSKIRIPARPMLMEKSDEDSRMAAEGMSQEERDLRKKEKKKGLSKEQKEELAQYELERRRIREERVNTLAQKLVDRICVWTETDKGSDVTHSFNEKTKVSWDGLCGMKRFTNAKLDYSTIVRG